ncbi:MAG: hypothetical protein Kow0090_17780 [Myxococcota bacterium]
MKLVECVPNFSEGRDRTKVEAIADAISRVAGATLLDVDIGAATNRTVITFVGSPDAASEAAFQAIKKAYEVIDMSKHTGEHPRQGACDVCPFVPVSGVTMAECVELAHRLGRRVGEELGLPGYFYEEAALNESRRNLADIRAGEYESLPEKIKSENWKPDFGPAEFNPRFGAVTIGAREFLIAYNINFNTRNKNLVHDIAMNIREKGRYLKDENDKFLRDESGEKLKKKGLFKCIKAIGWYIEEYSCAQLSINFTNYKVTPVHIVFDEVCRQAEERGLRVTGSELVGLMPKAALMEAGIYYLRKQKGSSLGLSEREIIDIAVKSLGLNDLVPFNAEKKIIEYCVREKRPLIEKTVSDFADILASDAPAPGGGSVAALCGGLSAALSAMVANLTVGKKGYNGVWEELSELAFRAQRLKEFFVSAIDDDTKAFNKVMESFGIKAKSDEEKALKKRAIEEATKEATLVPLSVLERTEEAIELAEVVAKKGNRNSLSDAGVGALCARTAADGAYYNVLINLKSIEDESFKRDVRNRASTILSRVREKATEIAAIVEDGIG